MSSEVPPDDRTPEGIIQRAFIDHVAARTVKTMIVSVEQPMVLPCGQDVRIPREMRENPAWGGVEKIIAYVRNVNDVPDIANVAIEKHDDGSLGVSFTWWEITQRIARNTEPPY